MSTAPTPPASPPPPPAGTPATTPAMKREITLISHSMLYYWWPIWVFGYILALVTYFENHRLAIIPADTKVTLIEGQDPGIATYQLKAKESEKSSAEVVAKPPRPATLESAVRATATPGEGDPFKTRVSQKVWLGPFFCVVLLLTVVITNVPLRGLWSFLALLLVLVLSLGISLVPNGWDSLLSAVGNLHIYINMAGYLFIATVVLILWGVSVYVFDHRTYMRVTPGQISICEHIGASIRNINGDRVEVEKRRDDMFRHWLWGWGTGDIVLRLTDTKEEVRLPNVWLGFTGRKIEEVLRLIREKTTVSHG